MTSPPVPVVLPALVAAAAWQAAYYSPVPAVTPWLVMLSLAGLCLFARVRTARRAFYGGLVAGLGVVVPHLWFLLGIFSTMAPVLWLLVAVWHGVFAATLHWLAHLPRWKGWWTIAAAPALWMGFEFFRLGRWPRRHGGA